MNILQYLAAIAALGWMVAVSGGQTPLVPQPVTAEPQLTILDTDIGDDIDDAFALALVLHSPELRLLGVTTAYGDTELRARLVDRFLGAVGRSDIPVAAGVATPSPNHFSQAAYAKQSPERKHVDAVEFLLEQIREHPGEITLIAIGPLNNIEAAIQKDPVTFRKLKRAVLMSGSIYRGYGNGKPGAPPPPSAEYNVRCDPAGLKELLAVGVPVIMMPLDSTQISLQHNDRKEIFPHGSPLTDQLTLLYVEYARGIPAFYQPGPTLFDAVAVTYAIRPDLCPATPVRIEVDDKGYTRPVEGATNAQVCLQSDEKGFLDLLVSRITTDAGR